MSVVPDPPPPGVDRLSSFAPIVAAAEDALTCKESRHLQHEVLAALLEDPVYILCGKPFLDNDYEEISIKWKLASDSKSAVNGMVHEVSQSFVRPLSFGRQKCFCIHRFSPSDECTTNLNTGLNDLALNHAQQALSDTVGETNLRGSNIGGFQDILDSKNPLCAELRTVFVNAVERVSAKEVECVHTADKAATPPSSPRKDAPFAAWMNVSRKGNLNHLHNHGTSAWAAVAYTRVPQAETKNQTMKQGALLLRLSYGTGSRFMEPDEDLHVPRMWQPLPEEQGKEVSTESKTSSVRYLALEPVEGSVVVFPGWISHSVSPHFSEEARVCFASNWS